MRITRNSPPASAAQLEATAADLRSEVAGLEEEERDFNAALADLVGDPVYAEVEARVRELRFLIPSKRDTLARIEKAIPVAADRERRAAFADRKADLDRRTAKLARTAGKRFPELAGPLADLLNELVANEREWSSLRDEARELGEEGGICHHAEVRARIDLPGARVGGIYRSVLREVQIPNWHGGKPLFDADLRPRN
ncbi:MAG: hypothetical protein ACTHJK_09050 [Sphingomicrobium sp.]